MSDTNQFDVREVVFLPTAQHNEDNPWLPNYRGILRIRAALACLKAHPKAVLVIAGGYANHRGVTYADRMVAFIAQHHEWALDRLMVVAGLLDRTVDNLTQSILILGGIIEEVDGTLVPSLSKLYFCSEQPHFDRVEWAIRTLGFEPVFVPSGADHSIYPADNDQIVVEMRTVPGKTLGLGAEATQWAAASHAAAARQASFCQTWSDIHPTEDQNRHSLTMRVLRKWSRQVYIESPALRRPKRPPVPTFLSRENA